MDLSTLRRPEAAGIVLAMAAFAMLYTLALKSPGIDFWRPWATSRTAVVDVYSRAGRERLYQLVVPPPGAKGSTSREHRAAVQAAALDVAFLGYRGIDVVQPPLFLSVFRVFSTDNYERDYRWFLAVSLVCFFTAVYVLGRIVGFSVLFALVTASALGFVLGAEVSTLDVGNVNNIQLALVVAFLLLQLRSSTWADVASGAVLALGIAFKPNIALLALAIGLTWAGCRLWRKTLTVGAGFALGALLALGLSAMLLSSSAWRNWLAVVPELLGSVQPLEYGNIAVSAIILEQWDFDSSLILIAVGLVALAAAALRPLWALHPAPADAPAFDRTFLGVASGSALIMLSSRLVWEHYVVLAMPALLLVVRGIMDQGGARSWALALAITPLSLGCIIVLKFITGTCVLAANAMNVSLLVLFGWALGCLWRSGARHKDGTSCRGRSTAIQQPL